MLSVAFYMCIWLMTLNTHLATNKLSYPHKTESKILHRSKRDISVYSDDKKWKCPETYQTLCYYMHYDYNCNAHSDCPGNKLCCLFACSYDCARPVTVPQIIVEDYEYDATDYSYEDLSGRMDQPTTPRQTVEGGRFTWNVKVDSSESDIFKLKQNQTYTNIPYRNSEESKIPKNKRITKKYWQHNSGNFHGIIQLVPKDKRITKKYWQHNSGNFHGIIQLIPK